MSVNRENVIWQSSDGTWNRGFYTCHQNWWRADEDDYDPEWDVEYDTSSFEWASTGHRSVEAAREAWHGANPGGWNEYPHTPDNAQQCGRFDAMAATLWVANRAAGRR